ncbi:MAG: M16 family metallopeptidase [Leptolyngbyaceae cyanobacterium]
MTLLRFSVSPHTRHPWRSLIALFGVLLLTLTASPLPALARDIGESTVQPYLDRVAEQVSEFTLDNGMTFIVLERHQAPVVSFMLYANVGAANEEDGETGMAHYLEHLAFKGTTQIGTLDYGAEQPLIVEMDAVFDQLLAAEAAGDEAAVAELSLQLEALQAEAREYVKQNEYGQIIDQAGGQGLNATTSADATRYFYSLPSNKLELWMSLESERFLDPVFREFYEEKEVILEERRLRVDNSPIGKLIEVFLEESFEQHPYRRPVIGYEEDLFNATRAKIDRFFHQYYGPNNLTATVVGDVDPTEVKAMAEAYFGRYTARALPAEVEINEPPQTAPKDFTLALPSQPWYLEGYHRPGITHPDHAIYGMIESILVNGRTARLYKTLVEDEQVALDVGGINGFPGDRYENLMVLYGLTTPESTTEDIAALMRQELDQLINQSVSEPELERVKTQARASLLSRLASNSGMASLLAEYQAKTGSWQNVFSELATIESVTAADIQRVAQATFQPQNRTVGRIVPSEE